MAHLLIIDDEASICYAFRRYFEARGLRVSVAATARAGLDVCRRDPPDVALVDVCLPDADGIGLLGDLRQAAPAARFLVITAFGTLETATRAVAGEAFDYLVKPLDLARVAQAVTQALESGRSDLADATAPAASTHAARGAAQAPQLVGAAPAMQEVYKQIAWAARSSAAVIVVGATGTGKELTAQSIHDLSPRRAGPFVAVNCGALPESLVESELFGYTRGAFSGAVSDKPGRFETAHGGTLFLDEIGDLPPAAQVKLLRFLDTQQVDRLGSLSSRALDVRIVAATHRDLAEAVAAGTFRQDLYYRLAVIVIHLPALRDRCADIAVLARHFLAALSPSPPALSAAAAACLEAWPWPGNVRELRNVMQHALAVCSTGPILVSHLPPALRGPHGDNGGAAGSGGAAGAARQDALEAALAAVAEACDWRRPGVHTRAVEALERYLIRRAMADADGHQIEAAEHLGMHRNTLRRKLLEDRLKEPPGNGQA